MYNVSDTYRELIKAPVRYTGISGAARLRDGTIIHLTDDNIAAGSLSITQKMNGRGDFRPGGVYSGELSCSLKGFAGKTSDLDSAAIRLAFILYHDSDMQAAKSETVPLGRFYVDGSAIKRRNDTVTLFAFDGMALFDVEATERSGTLYELVCGACSAAGVSLGMTQAEFEALPNAAQTAKINTARIQTERDLLMYVGMMTASFARISRSNELEFVPLTCERNDGGVIVPVREIAGNIRFNTDFSDDTTCIAKLFTRRNGAAVYSTREISAGGSEKLAVMELNENPLLAELSDDVVTGVLNNELLQMYKCLNRVFDSSFTGDPALEIGDYVRLRGGAIDTDRGYATGMITSQIWRYRGQHTIKCSMPSSLSAVGETEVQTLALDDSSSDITAPPVRTQPKSQLQKQIDELRKQISQSGGTAGVLTEYQYLTDASVKFNGTTYTIEKDATTGLISKISDSYNHEFKPSISPGITDVALHNAVFWVLAMCRGLGEIPQKTLFDGTGGAWSYSGGLTGFQKVAGNQPYSGIDSEAYYTSGAKVLRLSKAYRLEDSEDNYTDAIIIRSNEQISLSGYSKLRILAFAFTNYAGLDGKVYFEVGEPGAAVPGKAYDFSAWKLVGSCDGFSTNYSEPGTPKWYEADVSALGGNQYLNFGVYHGSQVYAYTSYFDIHKIILIP
jgi:hypothetical protein